MKKIIALFLVLAVCFTALPFAAAAEKDDVVKYSVKVNSSIVGEKYVAVIKSGDKILMCIDDICMLTNSTPVADGDIIVIKRGSRNVNINTANKQLIEAHLEQPKPIVLEVVDGEVYLPAYSMLTYLGADCLLRDGAVQIRMPLFSFWDANDFDMSKYALDLNQLWGKNLKWHMLNNIISELVFDIGCVDNVFYVPELLAGYDRVIEDVMRDSLDINPLSYKSVKEEYKIDFNFEDALNKHYKESLEAFDDVDEMFSKCVDIAGGYFDYMSDSKFAAADKLIGSLNHIKEMGQLVRESGIFKGKKKVLNDSNLKKNIAKFMLDVSTLCYINSNYAEDGVYAIGSFQENMRKVDYESPYYKTSAKIYNSLISDEISYRMARMDKMKEELIDFGSEQLTETLLGGYAPIVDAVDLYFYTCSLLPTIRADIERCSAELRAMYLVTLQSITCRLLTDKLQEIDNIMNEYNLAEYKQLLSFWARVSMAANERLIECGKDAKAAKARNEELALILYKLNNCQVIGIYWQDADPVFSKAELKESGNFEWIIEPSIEADDIQPIRLDSPNVDGLYAEDFNYNKINKIIRSGKSGGINYQGKIMIPIGKNIQPCLEGIVSEDHESNYNDDGMLIEGPWGHGGFEGFDYFDVEKNKVLGYFTPGVWNEANELYSDCFLQVIKPGNELDGYDITEKYVYVNKQCQLITQTQFDDVATFREGLAAVCKDSKWGYINTVGKTAIPFEYDYAYSFGDGIAAVCKDGKWGYIDKNNNTVIDFAFEATRPHYKGQAWVKQNGKWGVIQFSEGIITGTIDIGKTANVLNDIEVSKVDFSLNYTAIISKSGDLYTWGKNNYGQLGDGTSNDSFIPIKIMENVIDVSISLDQAACITKDGSLYMWGDSSTLYFGTQNLKRRPQKLMDNISSVCVGNSCVAAITKDGSLYMWGSNDFGQLGNGTKSFSYEPVKIMDNVVSVSLGGCHSACITKDGSLYSWGESLGNGLEKDSSTPIKIMDDVLSVSLGDLHGACITKDSSLYLWGENGSGQIGNGTTKTSFIPVKVMDNVSNVSLSGYSSACVTKDGKLYTWGDNRYSQLGNGTTLEEVIIPKKIMDNVDIVSIDDEHGACITKDGNLYMWGENKNGELGDGTVQDSNVPIKINIFQ